MMEMLVLVPGLLCDAAIWQPQIDELSAEYDIYVPDLRSFDSIEAMAEHVLGTAPDRFSIAGHSMGARVALEVVRKAPSRVSRLALLDTGAHPIAAGEADRRKVLTDLSRSQGMQALFEPWLRPMVAAYNYEGTVASTLQAMLLRMDPEIHARQIAALLSRPDASQHLGRIAVPTLVGVGAEDSWSPPAQNKAIADALAVSDFVVFARSGHMAPLEAPVAVIAALRAWMSRAPGPAR